MSSKAFAQRAEEILALPISFRVNSLGGYGAEGEVIYEKHPLACPSVLVENQDTITATFMSNGSLNLLVKRDDGMEINVLRGHFDQFEKREIGVPSSNVWFASDDGSCIASLINTKQNINAGPQWIKLVKLGDPERAYWYCAGFAPAKGIEFVTAVRHTMVMTKAGPAIARQVYIRNTGSRKLKGSLWPFFDLRGTQLFVYNKEIWYDMGLPLSKGETLIAASLPYSTIMQIKRISSITSGGVKAGSTTCDYLDFVGDSAAYTLIPDAVAAGGLLSKGAGQKFNRFSTPTIYAQQFSVNLAKGQAGTIDQSLLYITDDRMAESFRKGMQSRLPDYRDMSASFKKASLAVVRKTKGARDICLSASSKSAAAVKHPDFELRLPAQLAVQEYANSVWTGVEELYENCRAHGAKMAEGIEIGTRDRGQDMWPKLKENPGRVRKDLVHLFSFMFYHSGANLDKKKKMTLTEKLHGTFPRQYPSRWDNRDQKVPNDNRPYSDSALWPIDSIVRYIEETGDHSILLEKVKTVKLTDPEHPVTSEMVGHDKTFYIAEVMFEILAAFERHANDSPYGIVQTLYGDWCDPIDMFGTDPLRDYESRGRGRGGNTRLAAHTFMNAVATADLMEIPAIQAFVSKKVKLAPRVARIKKFADRLRKNIVKYFWEDGQAAGFIDYLHEFRKDGSRPAFSRGETGYALGSWKGKDFDGLKRRGLVAQAWCMIMLITDRSWLGKVKGRDAMVKKILNTTEKIFFDPKLGLKLFTPPLANKEDTLELVGRVGIVPAGTAENGEYHHGQTMMHLFRLRLPNQADKVWKQFKPIMSVMRDEDLCGPFEMPSTSYASDKADPHFGAGMYFGLSGSTDWIVNIFEKVAGLHLKLHDAALPDLTVCPNLPKEINEQLTFKRFIHQAERGGMYRKIPLTIKIDRKGSGKLIRTDIKVNGKKADKAEIQSLKGLKKVNINITYIRK
ncbi:GH36-type glycosyl hydrolase domain-containing protein [Planctomycetota bacterium]